MSISTMTYAGIASESVAIPFRGQLGNFLPAPQSQPVVPGFAEAIAGGLVFLIQLVALQDLCENSFHGKIIGIDDGISCPNGSGMMRVAGRSHGQTANLRVLESVAVVAAERSRSVENLDRVHRQGFQSGKTDAGAEQIIRVWRNGETAAFMNDVADFARWF